MRLSTRIGLDFLVAVVFFILAVAVCTLGFDVARREAQDIRSNIQPIVSATNHMLTPLEQMESAELLYFTKGAGPLKPLEQFDGNAAEFETWFARASQLVATSQGAERLKAVSQGYRAFMVTDGRMRELISAGRTAEAEALNLGESMRQAEQLRQAVRDLRHFKLAEVDRRLAVAESAMSLAEMLAVAIALVGIILGGALWRKSLRAVGEPLQALLEGTRATARMRFEPVEHPAAPSTAELYELQSAFNAMSSQIQSTTAELRAAREALERKVEERTADLVEANERLSRMVEDLKAVDKLRSDLVAVVSHELLTPINFVTGHGSLLQDEVLGPLSAAQHRAVKAMLDGARRLTRMVRNMLEFAQIGRGMTINAQEVDYGDIVRSAVEAVAEEIGSRNQQVEVNIPGDFPPVLADPDRAGQILSELLDNAIKFTPEGGRIRVDVGVSSEAVETIVSDTGPGIHPDALARLTEPFYQADLSSTRQYGGLGLGLAIVRHLVDRMGGSLAAESQPGVGSTFRFTLPRADIGRQRAEVWLGRGAES